MDPLSHLTVDRPKKLLTYPNRNDRPCSDINVKEKDVYNIYVFIQVNNIYNFVASSESYSCDDHGKNGAHATDESQSWPCINSLKFFLSFLFVYFLTVLIYFFLDKKCHRI